MNVRTIFTILWWIAAAAGHAQPAVPISDDIRQHIFSFHEIEYFEDQTGKLRIDDVLVPEIQSRFKPNKKFNPENEHRQSVYWHKIKILHNASSKEDWVIEFFDQTIDRI